MDDARVEAARRAFPLMRAQVEEDGRAFPDMQAQAGGQRTMLRQQGEQS